MNSVVVTRFFFVITSSTGRLTFFSKRRSRLVTIPTNLFTLSTTGIPPILNSLIISSTSCTRASFFTVMGSMIIPFSARFTFLISLACCSMVIFLWITPIPPSWAIAIAITCSVTVSIAAETMGMFSRMFLVNCEDISTSRGRISE